MNHNKTSQLKGSAVMGSVLLLISLSFPVFATETTLSMEIWSRYTAGKVENIDELSKSQIGLSRGYFRLEPKFSDRISGRFNIDLFSDEDFPDGAGLKLKYAYLDFKEVLPIPESKITAGLIKPYFGFVYDWDYTTIQKVLEDAEKVVASTDYGAALYGYLPGGYGEYALGAYNGEGYTHTGSEVNINPAAIANLRIIPLPGITIGGSVLYEKAGILDTLITEYSDRLLYVGVGRLAYGPVDIFGEFLVKDYDDVKSMGFMVMPVLNLKRLANIDVDLIGRFDQWDKNAEEDDDMHRRFIGGFNWYIFHDSKGKPMVWIQVNGERKTYEAEDKPYVNELGIQLRWKFSGKIKS